MGSSQNLILGGVMILAGIGIPVMATLNGGLGTRLGNPVQAATILFALALTISVVVMMIQPKAIIYDLAAVPTHYFFGGVLVAFYVLAVTFIGPRIGIGNAIVLVLLGQTLTAALIDHFAWFGTPQVALTQSRVVGCLLVLIGVVLARRPTIDV